MQALSLVDGLITKIEAVEDDAKTNRDSGLTLGYWNIRGLADFIRLMLYYKNVNYTEKIYQEDEEWQKQKYNLNMEFPNLPYLMDRKKNLIMTESYAIGKYLAKKYNIGYNVDKNNRELQIEGVVGDILMRFFRLCFNANFENDKVDYLKSLIDEKDKLYHIEKYLESKVYLVSDKELTFIDFKFFSYLDYNVRLDQGFLDKLKNINRYYQAICNMDFINRFQKDGLRNLAIVKPSGIFGDKPV